jgi:hypothetical protein
LDVIVVESTTTPQCSDGIDNDGDGFIDWGGENADPGCSDPNDNSENEKPVIMLIGDANIIITEGDSYNDAGATAMDAEDGDLTASTTVSSNVSTSTPGTYQVSYNVSDSEGLAADEVVRTVLVKEKEIVTPTCTNCGGGGGGSGGGGGGGIIPTLNIFNEKLEFVTPTSILLTWETDKDATSRVVYDSVSHKQTTYAPNIGYASSTEKVETLVKKHSMLITGLQPDTQYFFRPISKAGGNLTKTGNEKTFSLASAPIGGQCNYLNNYLRMGDNNNPLEVVKLQEFLKDYEGFTNLQVNGVFDQATFDAVSAFQEKYKDEVLTPWGVNVTTGYVYYTTQKKINEIYCEKEFPLNQTQLSEINNFKTLISQPQTGEQGTIDFNAIGRANTPAGNNTTGVIGSASAGAGLAAAGNVLTQRGGQNGQVASIIGSTENGGSTTTQSVTRKGLVASVFDAVKDGVGSLFKTIKGFFVKDKTAEENTKTDTSGEDVSATSSPEAVE